MKKKLNILTGLLLLMLFADCSNIKKETNGTKFSPENHRPEMTDADRREAIEKKRQELAEIENDVQELIFGNNLKLTVLQPAVKGDVTQEVSNDVFVKMLHIVASNGMGGVGNSPAFALAVAMTPTDRMVTGSVPQRMLTSYKLTFLVVNMLTNEVCGTYEQTVQGVGASYIEATRNAVKEIKNTNELQLMLADAKSKIMNWLIISPKAFISAVERCVENKEYTTAYAILASIPSEAEECYAYAISRQESLLLEMKNQHAEETLLRMKDAIAKAGVRYSPEVAGCMLMLPAESTQMTEAKSLYSAYTKQIQDAQADSIAHERKLQMERLEMEKIKLQYEIEASAKAAENSASQSSARTNSNAEVEDDDDSLWGWGLGLGALTLGVGWAAVSLLETALASSMFVFFI